MHTTGTQNLTFKGSELLFFNSQQTDNKPTKLHTRSIPDYHKNISSHIQPDDTSAVPSRLRAARHVYGFRTYNRTHRLQCDLNQATASVKDMLNRPFTGLDRAIDEAERALAGLHSAESKFYEVVDGLTKYERKAKELDFLKQNVERCITTSIANVKSDLRRVSRCQGDSHTSPALSHGLSTIQTLDKMVKGPWRGHIQLRTQIDKIKITLLSTSNLESMIPGLQYPKFEVIGALLKQAETYLVEKQSLNKIKQIATAGIDEDIMSQMLKKLHEFQGSIANAIILRQAITSTVSNMSREAIMTTQALKRRTKSVQSMIRVEQNLRDIDAEENVLIDFIRDGQQFEKKYKKEAAVAGYPLDTAPRTNSRKRPFDLLSPNTSPEVRGSTDSPRPVWAQAWTAKTKVLKTKRSVI